MALSKGIGIEIIGDLADTRFPDDDFDVCTICRVNNGKLQVLSCLHVYCQDCLDQVFQGKAACDTCIIVCCGCQQVTEVESRGRPTLVNSLSGNEKSRNEAKKIVCTSCDLGEEATTRCLDCEEYLCALCSGAHQSMLFFKSHQNVDAADYFKKVETEKRAVVFCNKHPAEALTIFCVNCEFPVCEICASDHLGHFLCTRLEDAAPLQKEELESLLVETREISMKSSQKTMSSIEQALSDLRQQHEKAEEALLKKYEELKNDLDRRTDQSRLELQQLLNEEESKLRKMLTSAEKNDGRLKTAVKFTTLLLKNGNIMDILSLKKVIRDQLASLNNYPSPNTKFLLKFDSLISAYKNAVEPSQTSQRTEKSTPSSGTTACGTSITGDEDSAVPVDIPPDKVREPVKHSSVCTSFRSDSFKHDVRDHKGTSSRSNSFKDDERDQKGTSFRADCFEDDERDHKGTSFRSNSIEDDQRDHKGTSFRSNSFEDDERDHKGTCVRSNSIEDDERDHKGTSFRFDSFEDDERGRRGKVQTFSLSLSRQFGEKGSSKGEFQDPLNVCVGWDGDIIVADTGNNRIQIFDRMGHYKKQFGNPVLRKPFKVAAFKDTGDVVVGDRGSRVSLQHVNPTRLMLYTRCGSYIRRIRPSVPVVTLAALSVTKRGDIVVVDYDLLSPTVLVIDRNDNVVLCFGCKNYVQNPTDIIFWGNEFYICDYKGRKVVVFGSDGTFQRTFEREQVEWYPAGIDVTDAGIVLVGSSEFYRFRVTGFDTRGWELYNFHSTVVASITISRCGGMKITPDLGVVTVTKGENFVLVAKNNFIKRI